MIVRKQTELLVAQTQNKAKEILANATANSEVILASADVNYSRTIENVHNEGNFYFFFLIISIIFILNKTKGLKNMIEGLKLESNKLKSSFNYMRSLKDHEKIKYSIDFNSFFKTSGK